MFKLTFHSRGDFEKQILENFLITNVLHVHVHVMMQRRHLLADRFLRMFQMVANCELRRTGTQTSDAAGIFWKL